MSALEAALGAWQRAAIEQVRAKSIALTELLLQLVGERLEAYGFAIASPIDAACRGSQVSLAHHNAYAIVQALITRGVIGDFRAPDLVRFGVAPLYTRFVDVFDAVEHLEQVMRSGEYAQPAFADRALVT
jgi:kynureninase